MRNFFALCILFLALLGCTTQPTLGKQEPSLCSPAFQPSRGLLSERLVIYGEMHGTVESPAIVGEHACLLKQNGRRVVLGLEIPIEQQQAIDQYLQSSGSSSDRQTLLAGSFWRRPLNRQDGRSSQAVFELIEFVRKLAQDGGNISILAFSAPDDQVMAKRIRLTLEQQPDAKFVVLTGSVHAFEVAADRGEPMAYLLQDQNPMTIVISFIAGSAWNCGPSGCGPIEYPATAARETGYLTEGDIPRGYDQRLRLRSVTASSPAIGTMQ